MWYVVYAVIEKDLDNLGLMSPCKTQEEAVQKANELRKKGTYRFVGVIGDIEVRE